MVSNTDPKDHWAVFFKMIDFWLQNQDYFFKNYKMVDQVVFRP